MNVLKSSHDDKDTGGGATAADNDDHVNDDDAHVCACVCVSICLYVCILLTLRYNPSILAPITTCFLSFVGYVFEGTIPVSVDPEHSRTDPLYEYSGTIASNTLNMLS
jgi:hypothetical protein